MKLGRRVVSFILFYCVCVLCVAPAHSDVIKFSEEELAKETVLPKFDTTTSVKKQECGPGSSMGDSHWWRWEFTGGSL